MALRPFADYAAGIATADLPGEALPMAIVMSTGGLLNMIDGVFVGRFVGAHALAAVSLALSTFARDRLNLASYGWVDELKVFAERPALEVQCNHARGTLVGLPDGYDGPVDPGPSPHAHPV